jgi:O-antigen ligase
MITAVPTSRVPALTPQAIALATIAAIAASTLIALRAMASQNMILVIVAVIAIPLAIAMIAWPELATLAVIFILFTNAADVAEEFHGVPYLVAASFPLLLCVPLFYYLVARREQFILPRVLPLICIFALIQFVGALFSKDVSLAIPGLLSFLLEGLAVYVLLTNVIRTPKLMRQVIWALLIAGLFAGALSFYQQVTRTFNNNYGGFAQMTSRGFDEVKGIEATRQYRLAGPIGEQNRYAQIMLMLLPLGLLRCWDERSLWLRAVAVAATAFVAVGIVLTFSRGAAIGCGVLILIMAYMRYITARQLGLILLGGIVMVAAFPGFLNRLASLYPLLNLHAQLSDATADADGAVKGRATAMLTAAMVCADNPLIGVGPNMFRFHYKDYARLVGPRYQDGNWQSHNLYLGIAADNGLLGLICFLAIIYVTLRDLVRIHQRWERTDPELAKMAVALMLAIVAYLVTGMGLHFAYVRYFWLFMAMAGALTTMSDRATRGQVARA